MSLRLARAFFYRGLQEALSYRVAFGLRLVTAVSGLLALVFFSRFVNSARVPDLAGYGGDYYSFALVGIVALGLQHRTVAIYPQLIRVAQLTGTLDAMLATPTPGWQILIFSPLYQLASSVVSAVLALIVGTLVTGRGFGQLQLTAVICAVPLTLAAFIALGCIGAALTMVLRRGDPISAFLGGSSPLLAGVFYPPSTLPRLLRVAADLLPITHGLEVLRRSMFAGAGVSQLGRPLIALALLSLILLPLSLLAFTWALRLARRDGSLSHY